MNWSIEPIPLRDDHGTLRIGATRVTLDTLLAAYSSGSSAEQLVEAFPSLTLADVYSVLGYYLRHTEQVENEYLAPRRLTAQALQQRAEARLDPNEVRERLRARRAAQRG